MYHVILLNLSKGKRLAIYSVGSGRGAEFSSHDLEECQKFIAKNKHLETYNVSN